MSDIFWTALWTAMPPTLVALAALVTTVLTAMENRRKIAEAADKADDAGKKVDETGKKVDELHIQVNSRLSELLEITRVAAEAKGREDQRVEHVAKAGAQVIEGQLEGEIEGKIEGHVEGKVVEGEIKAEIVEGKIVEGKIKTEK